MTPTATPAEALCAIDGVAEDALALSERAFDEATMSYRNACDLIQSLRVSLQEIRACVAETRVVLPPGPLVSEAVRVIREELRRELEAVPDGGTQSVGESQKGCDR